MRKWYKKLNDYNFNTKTPTPKVKGDEFYINMGVALIFKSLNKVGFGYCFANENKIIIIALYDKMLSNNQKNDVFPAV